jgi:hypothetical protein
MPEPTPQETPKTEEIVDPGQQKNKIQVRIDQLYGQKKEAEEVSASLKTENEGLRTQITELNERVGVLETPATPAPNPVIPTGQQEVVGIDEAKIAEIVSNTVGKMMTERDNKVQTQQHLRQQHTQSWGAAVRQMPSLKDVKSELYQTAQALFERDPELQRSPNGPMKAAIMARGIVGNDNVDPNLLNAAAQGGGGANNLSGSTADAKLADVDKRLAAAKDALNTGVGVSNAWGIYKDLQAERAALIKQKGA